MEAILLKYKNDEHAKYGAIVVNVGSEVHSGILMSDGCVVTNEQLVFHWPIEPILVLTPDMFVINEDETVKWRAHKRQYKMFTNPDRFRKYGVRPGDIVRESAFGRTREGIVSYVESMDNNRIHVWENGKSELVDYIPEWCIVLTKVEDRK